MLRLHRPVAAVVAVGVLAIAGGFGYRSLSSTTPSLRADPRQDVVVPQGRRLPRTAWPAVGQAAVRIGRGPLQRGPDQHAAPIASLAKVMTAYLVLRDHPLRPGEDGPVITIT